MGFAVENRGGVYEYHEVEGYPVRSSSRSISVDVTISEELVCEYRSAIFFHYLLP
jgi:hypothetical protein